jgi:hypothetical protein
MAKTAGISLRSVRRTSTRWISSDITVRLGSCLGPHAMPAVRSKEPLHSTRFWTQLRPERSEVKAGSEGMKQLNRRPEQVPRKAGSSAGESVGLFHRLTTRPVKNYARAYQPGEVCLPLPTCQETQVCAST